jgi:uroporphyrinogen-III synthase/uroporphyrinogen III methyltransferase/synthase
MIGRRPLAGSTIVITRPAERSERLVNILDQRGARVLLAPAIELRPVRSAALTRAIRDLASGAFSWIVLTSPATVRMLDQRLEGPRDVAAKVAALGEGTADAFARWSRRQPDLMPRTFTVAGLARAFPRGRGQVLCARADIAPDGLEDALVAKGWSPTRVDAYRTVFPRALPQAATTALRAGEVDAITFTSASTVRGFLQALGTSGLRGAPKVVCIGPVTAKEARAHGLRVHAVADPHTTDGLVDALERALTPRRRAAP